MQDFNDGLLFYESLYGSQENRDSALAFGSMSRVYAKNNDERRARECLWSAMAILNRISGEKDPDYVYFENIESKLHEYME